jgi:hypothetical protein
MEQLNIKKALFLDNEGWGSNNILDHLIIDLKKQGVECRIFDSAHERISEIGEQIMWCDSIFFHSTFLYPDQIEVFYKLLMKIPSKKIFGKASDGNLIGNLEQIFNIQQLSDLSKHEVFDLIHLFIPEDIEWHSKVDMLVYGKELARLEEERININKGIYKTGRKVLVHDIKTPGDEFSELKNGVIVDELDFNQCESLYNKKCSYGQGVWVMGKTVPVKLLNANEYNEFEYVNPGSKALTLEFFSRGKKLHETDLMATIQLWIYNCSAHHSVSNSDIWQWCDKLCNMLSLDRRDNRHYFEEKLMAYRKQHQFFKESSITQKEIQNLYKGVFIH